MGYQPHYIASFENESGLNQYYEPFLIPEKAFPQLEDAFAFRGQIKRRQGFSYLGRLRRDIGDTSLPVVSATPIYSDLDIVSSVRATEPNAEIQPGSLTITLDKGGVNESIFIDDSVGGISYVSGTYTLIGIPASTINYATGDLELFFTLAGPASPPNGTKVNVDFFYYPGLPVMGLPDDVTTLINEQNLRAFDTKYAYQFVSGVFTELPSTTPTIWHGSDSDFFWTINYWHPTPGSLPLMWTTNFFNSTTADVDPLRYYDGTDWTTLNPLITATDTVYTCRCVVPYKNRLLLFNTWEGTTAAGQKGAKNYPQRLRYSEIGDPLITSSPDAWRTDIKGKGGFIDVTSDEQIVSVEFIKDVLIVKLERSSWKIVYSGNKILPFLFEKINTELGAESTFSLVPFDRGIFSVGNVGILTDDSVNVSRIDQIIPQVVFSIRNADHGPTRVQGIRDFTNEVVYWTFPSSSIDRKFPNQVLVYNYINQTYAIFNDSFTCYGYYQKSSNNIWSYYNQPENTWNNSNFAWNSGVAQARYPDVAAGNQQGFVEQLNQQTGNGISLAINAITPAVAGSPVVITSQDHNLVDGQFVQFSGIMGTGIPNPSTLNGSIYRVQVTDPVTGNVDENLFTLELAPTFDQVELLPGGTYIGGGRITVFNNLTILTKVFAPFYEQGGQARLGYIDFLMDRTDSGELACNIFVDEATSISISDELTDDGLLGTKTVLTSPENLGLIPYQATQDKIWHRFFVQSIAQNFQLKLSMTDIQMSDKKIATSPINLHAMTLYVSKNARMTQ